MFQPYTGQSCPPTAMGNVDWEALSISMNYKITTIANQGYLTALGSSIGRSYCHQDSTYLSMDLDHHQKVEVTRLLLWGDCLLHCIHVLQHLGFCLRTTPDPAHFT